MNKCKKCGEEDADLLCINWGNLCKLCCTNYLKNLVNWSGNKEIDDFIRKIQFKRSSHNDIVFEWISYDQFYDIKAIGKGGFATIYSAVWRDGSLYHNNNDNKEYIRDSYKTVALKQLHNSQNISNDFLREV